MNTDQSKLLYKEESDLIIGCAMEVLNTLGHGFHEKPYENALVVEFGLKDVPVEQQKRFEMIYKNQVIGQYVPDLLVFNKMIIDTKVIERITNHEVGQMMNYLSITGFKVGYILNFKKPKLEWKRVVR